jgi:hypothetical protein
MIQATRSLASKVEVGKERVPVPQPILVPKPVEVDPAIEKMVQDALRA